MESLFAKLESLLLIPYLLWDENSFPDESSKETVLLMFIGRNSVLIIISKISFLNDILNN